MKNVRYALDVSMLVRERPTGQARFVFELLKSLDATGRGGEFVIVLRKGVDARKLPPLKDMKVVTFGFGRELIWHQTFFPLYAKWHRLTPISLANAAPLWNVGIVAFHDITYKTCAKSYLSLRGKLSMWWHRFQYWWCSYFAQRVLTVSEFSRTEYARVYHYPLDRIYPLFNGWEHVRDFAEDEGVFNRFPTIRKGEYYFVLGNLFEFKNVALAVRTAIRHPDTQFVITGTTMKTSAYAIENHSNIVWTGYLSNAEVKTLTKNAKALFFPSLSEGFGIPPLEALALGTPAIVSRASCLPCVYGDFVHWIDDPTAETPIHPDELMKSSVKSPEPLLAKWSWSRLGSCFVNALDKKKIAVFVPRPLGTGGVGICLRNYLRHLDHSRYQLDFFVPEAAPQKVIDEIEATGGQVFRVPSVSKLPLYLFKVYRLLHRGHYDIAHVNMNTLSIAPLFTAWLTRIPMRISHSHSASHRQERLRHLIKCSLVPFSRLFTTHLVACSRFAAEFQFGHRLASSDRVTYLSNAIELDDFRFDMNKRVELRCRYGLSESHHVVGIIGRLVSQKNPLFLIRVFAELAKHDANARLMMVGEGALRNNIDSLAHELGISDKLILVGETLNANWFYNAFDVFCLPSLYEGLGLVLVEAQANGLKCVTSTEVPLCADGTHTVKFLSLSESIDTWAKEINAGLFAPIDRKSASESSCIALTNAGYSIAREADNLVAIYNHGK